MRILNFQRWKLPASNFSMTFRDYIWNDDISLNTNAKTNTLCFCIQRKCKWENLRLKNLLMFEDLTWNLSHLMVICDKTKPLQETLKHLKNFLHKLEICLETCRIGKKLSLTHLKLNPFNNLKNFSNSSNFNVETFNNSKNSLPHTFSNFNVENFKNLRNSPSHFWT
jgi:hypothetical protein